MSTKASSRSNSTSFGMVGEGVTTARQSSRVAVNEHSDGAVWHEKLVVCEGTNDTGREPLILVRSYYLNLETMEKVWDEPPSGASAIVYATPEERNKAEEQRTELELTLQMIPEDTTTSTNHLADEMMMVTDTTTTTANNNNNKKKTFFGRFRKSSKSTTSKSKNDQVDTAKDINLQKAIARSIQEQKGGIDDVELAMALSLSVADGHNDDLDDDDETNAAISFYPSHPDELTEEELFQRALERSQREKSTRKPPQDNEDDEDDDNEHLRIALERSQREKPAKPKDNEDDDDDEYLLAALERSKEDLVVRAPPVASLPKNYQDSLRDDSSSVALDNPKEHLSEDELELKMPAKPKPTFDPYGKW